MRIIGGEYRRRQLKSVPGLAVRPTADRLREALFNVLTPRLAGVTFVDAYAGSGAVGLEAFSRGAKRVVLIERNFEAIGVIRANLAALSIEEGVTVVRGSASLMLPNYPCDIGFLDPPYDQPNEYVESITALAETDCPLVIAQHASRSPLEDRYSALKKVRVLKQGDNSLSFFERV